MRGKGRARPGGAKGERNHLTKLTEQQVAEIRARYQPGYGTAAALAREYGVTSENVQSIVHRKSWRHL